MSEPNVTKLTGEVGEGGALTDRYMDGTYLQQNPDWHVEGSPWKARQIEELLARSGLSPATVCEIGCGAGEILRQLSLNAPQTEYVGYELSPQAFALCQTRQSKRVTFYHENILEVDTTYDCLLCIDVFEHVEDYFSLLRGLKQKAKHKVFHIPLDLSVPSLIVGWMMWTRRQFGHIHYFTQETAIAALKECGYEIVDGFYTAQFELGGSSWKGKIAYLPRRLLFSLSPRWCALLLGRCSYLVLAK